MPRVTGAREIAPADRDDDAAAAHAAGLPASAFPAIFLASASVLMMQIALNRIFSFTIWYHFAYISISLALLGFGASGSALAAFPRLAGRSVRAGIATHVALAAVTTLVLLIAIGSVRLDPFEMLRSKLELAKFVGFLTVVSLPFFFVGLAITVALGAAGPRVGTLYFWDLVGAAVGCAIVLPCITWLETPRVVVVAAMLLALAGVVVAGREHAALRLTNLALLALLAVAVGPLPSRLPFEPSADKQMAEWARSGSALLETQWGPIFRVDVMDAYKGQYAQFDYRYLGISLRYDGPAPNHKRIHHDGTAGAFIYEVRPDRNGLDMFHHHVLAAPYVVRDRPEVLVIGVGGGADILNAVEHGVAHVTGAELDPITVDILTRRYAAFNGHLFQRPDVSIVVSEGRHFARSTDQRYDLVQISAVDTLAALSTGAYILSENYLYTVEAYRDYFRILRSDGILSIGTIDFHARHENMARHGLRFAALSAEALRTTGHTNVGDHVMVIGSTTPIAEVELLTKLEPFTDAEIDAMERFVDAHGFEAWYLPRRPQRTLASYRTVFEGSPAEREAFFANTFLDLRPPVDDRPFFFSHYKWSRIFERRGDVDAGPTSATGQLVLALILVVACAFAVVAVLFPMFFRRHDVRPMPGRLGFLLYFAALGAGFIFVEISFVQRSILFLGYPTYSLSVTLFSFLLSAGLGAALSSRLPARPTQVLVGLTASLSAVLLAYVVFVPWVFSTFMGSPLAVRAAVTFALCLPLAGLLGVFFPFGIRMTSAIGPGFAAWAWAVNGCVTVAGSVGSIIVAMIFGFGTVVLAALAIYWLGAASFAWTYGRVVPQRAA